jgi:xanthine dehydrogenase accessory factor
VYDIAGPVAGWRQQGLPVWVARVVEVRGMSSRWPGEAVALLPGGEAVGSLLAGAADGALRAHVEGQREGRTAAGVFDVEVGDADAVAQGLACGGWARILVQRADQLPDQAWAAFHDRRPVGLVTDLGGDATGRTRVVDAGPPEADDAGSAAQRLLRGGATGTAQVGEGAAAALAAAYWPTPRLVVVGEGLVADALRAQAAALGWAASVQADAAGATQAARSLQRSDGVVVLSHDRDVDVPTLAAALESNAGYVGALGSRHTQAARAAALERLGVDEPARARIHGPAGLDIGSRTPAEIALAIAAEMLAARSGASGQPISRTGGPIHRTET